mmetsp:Transcript_9088/g.26116  ORF Transcript_9088/g.26116 Transcript_9088/m.26116 type:complete len:225 (+) Transcript_9088:1410-2084(+)
MAIRQRTATGEVETQRNTCPQVDLVRIRDRCERYRDSGLRSGCFVLVSAHQVDADVRELWDDFPRGKGGGRQDSSRGPRVVRRHPMVQHHVGSFRRVPHIDAEHDLPHRWYRERLPDPDGHVRPVQRAGAIGAHPWRIRQVQLVILRRFPSEGARAIHPLVPRRGVEDNLVPDRIRFGRVQLGRELHLEVQLLYPLQTVVELVACGRVLVPQHPSPEGVHDRIS